MAAVLEDDVVHFCGLGDSRVYLLPDAGDGQMLTVDDSMAQLLIAGGTPRAEAEASKQAHSITRWLGKDSAEIVPRVGQVRVTGPGLAARVLRRAVELRLGAGRAQASRSRRRDPTTPWWSRGTSSRLRTPRVGRTTSPPRSLG